MNFLDEILVSDHFKAYEFKCRGAEKGEPCCCHGAVQVHPRLVTVVQGTREKTARPIYVLNAFRCDTWNTHCKGHVASYHRVGKAADITSSELRSDLELWATTIAQILHDVLPAGAGNVIFYPDNAFIHVDVGQTVDPQHVVRFKLEGSATIHPFEWEAAA